MKKRGMMRLAVALTAVCLVGLMALPAASPPARADGTSGLPNDGAGPNPDDWLPYWDNSNGSAHYAPLRWPADSDWVTYTSQEQDIMDARSGDGSNGGRAPQNYVNASSSCTDQSTPSMQWYFDSTPTRPTPQPTFMFRWRVEQIPNTYATGPALQPYSSVDPWKAAQWTILIDSDGDGYREFAVNIYGPSGSPSTPVDVMRAIYSDSASQSIDYTNEADVYLLGDQPTAFVDAPVPNGSGTDYILNFQNSNQPVAAWPNGAAETVWDYGSTRSTDIGDPNCSEYFIDYQIPLAMLDATGVGGPALTEYTPICLTGTTANSNVDPTQKDVLIDGSETFDLTSCLPCGDLIIPADGTVLAQPVVDTITAAGCGPTTLTARVRDAIALNCQRTVASVDFYYYFDENANGEDDDGGSWTLIGAAAPGSGPSDWTLAAWDTTGLMNGSYLVGVRAEDAQGNVTWSYLSQAEVDAAHPGDFANPAVEPGVQEGTFSNSCGQYVELTKSAVTNPPYVGQGSTFDFQVTIDNGTSQDLTVDSLDDLLPPDFTFDSTVSSVGNLGGYSAEPAFGATGTISWTYAPAVTIAAGTTSSITFRVDTDNVPTGTYSNVASSTIPPASALMPGGTLTSDPVDVSVGSPELTILKSADVYSVEAGDTVTYTITYANDSAVNTTGVTLTDTLPAGTAFVSASGGGTYDSGTRAVTWNLPDLASLEGPYTQTIVVTIEKSASTSTVNTASIDSNETSPASASATIFVNSPMQLNKTADKTLVYPGAGNPDDQIVYTMTYENTGTSALTNVTITDPTPEGFFYASHTDDANFTGTAVEVIGDGYGNDDGVCDADEPCTVTWTAATLAAGATGSVTLTVETTYPYTGPTFAENIATMASTEAPDVTDNALTGVVEPGGSCSPYFFHNETTDTGFDGIHYVSDTNTVLETDTGTGILVTAPPGTNPDPPDNFLEVVRFYNPPNVNDETIVDTINTRIYFDRNPGRALWVRGEIFDYDPVTGTTTSLGFQEQLFNGNLTGLHEFTITPTGGTLLAGHRLLWIFSVQSNHKSQSQDVYFQFDGTVLNFLNDPGPPGTYTFANSHARLCSNTPALVITKDVDSATALPGDTLVYTIDFSNLGIDTATGSQVTDVLPTGTTFVSATLNGAATTPASVSGQTYVFDVNSSDTAVAGDVTDGESGQLVITVTVDNPLPAGVSTLTNTAEIDSNETSPVSDAVTTTVDPPNTPNLTIMKSADATRLIPGDSVTYTLLVINTGIAAASGITVTDTINNPAAGYFSYQAGSITGGSCAAPPCNDDSGAPTLTWTIDSLASGAMETLTYTVDVSLVGVPDGVNRLDNTATATEGTTGPYTSNTVWVTVSSNANVRITKSANPAGPVSPGDTVEYTMNVSNVGGSTATDVLVNDPVPANSSYADGTLEYETVAQTEAVDGDEGSFDGGNNRAVFDIGDLAAGASREMKFSVVVDEPLPSGTTTVTNIAVVSATNSSSKQGIAAVDAAAAPVLGLTKAAPAVVPWPLATITAGLGTATITLDRTQYLSVGDIVSNGGVAAEVQTIDDATGIITLDVPLPGPATALDPVIRYLFSYQNTGDADATNVTIRDTLAPGLTYVPGYSSAACPAATPVECTLGTVAAGESGLLELYAIPAAAGSYANFGQMLSAELDTFSSNTVTTAVGGIELAKATATATVTNDPSDGTPETGTYTITLTPQIAIPVTGVEVTDALPAGFTYNSTTSIAGGACGGTPAAGDTLLLWDTCTINAGSSLAITFNVDIPAGVAAGTYQNPVRAVATELEVLPFDELLTTAEDITVVSPGDVRVTKRVTDLTGTQITYEVLAVNLGSAAATGVAVDDTFPAANLTYSTVTAETFTVYDQGAHRWTIGTIPAVSQVTNGGTNYICIRSHLSDPAVTQPGAGTDWQSYWLAGGSAGAPWVPGIQYRAQNVARLEIVADIIDFSGAITNCADLDIAALTSQNTNTSNDGACATVLPTRVVLAGFDAAVDEAGRVVAEWTTAAETDTAGFYLHRLDEKSGTYLPVNDRLLPALFGALQGGWYRLVDEGAAAGEETTYLLVEAERDGTLHSYGPFTVLPSARRAARAPDGTADAAFLRIPRGQKAKAARARAARRARNEMRTGPVSDKGDRLKILVDGEGLYYVDGETVKDLLGGPARGNPQLPAGRRLSLANGGLQVPIFSAADGEGFYFFAREREGTYGSGNVYWLERGRGAPPGSAGEGPAAVSSRPASTFVEVIHAEEQQVLLTSPPVGAGDDYWFWAYLVAGYPALESRVFSVPSPAPADVAGDAVLTVSLLGFTETAADPDHHVTVTVNGTPVGEGHWNGSERFTFEAAFDSALLRDGGNDVAVRAVLDAGVAYSVFYVDSFELEYLRRAEAVGDSLMVRTGSAGLLKVGGFSEPDILVLDVTDPGAPARVARAVYGERGGFAVVFPAGTGERRYLAAAAAGAERPTAVVPASPARLAVERRGAEYVVIAPSSLAGAAAELVDYRESGGLTAIMATLEDIYDEFSHGLADAEAIRDFLRHAREHWQTKPRYVLLAGEGTFDHADHLGWGDSLVPVMIAETAQGLFPADNLYADMDGDHIPEMAVGRIPVVTAGELRNVIAKIRDFEGSASRRVVLAADNPDAGGDFSLDSDSLALLLPPEHGTGRIYLTDHTAAEARAMLAAEIAAGALQVNYIGHAGVGQLAEEGVLRTVDVPFLGASPCPPVVTALTCMVGQYAVPGYDSLSEMLLLREGTGATAVWSPSGLSYNALAVILGEEYFRAAYGEGAERLGDAVLSALQAFGRAGLPTFMLDIYNLLGDPALRLQREGGP